MLEYSYFHGVAPAFMNVVLFSIRTYGQLVTQ